jgi:glycosyltransferase involved in cell wall biosynthesis
MTIRVSLLVDDPGKRAHGNAVSRLALGLALTGSAEPTLVCYSDDPAPTWLPPQVRVHRLGVTRATRALPPLISYLRTEQPDVLVTRQVHANFVGLAALALTALPSRWHGKLVLVQDHPIRLSHAANWRDNKWLAKATYRFADGVISPSPAVREDIVRWCGLNPAAAAVVPNPIPKFVGGPGPAPHPWLRDGGPPVFVHTSNLTPWKRADLLIDAFAELSHEHDVRLLIVGEGTGRRGAVERISRRGLQARAQAVGWVADPLEYAARAQAFVLASDEEGFAQVLTEAMSVGCPVITTDAEGGGPRFVTRDGACGLLVPMGDKAGLVAAMRRMLDPDLRERYSELGLRRAESLSPEACAEALIEFLSARLGCGSELRERTSGKRRS